MKTIRQILGNILTCATIISVSMLTAGCVGGDDDENTTSGNAFALVTYTGNETTTTEAGIQEVSHFTYYALDGTTSTAKSTPATALPNTTAPAGQRMVIGYTPTDDSNVPYPTGTINLRTFTLVTTATTTIEDHEKAIANNSEILLYYVNRQPSINRTGPYINFEYYMPYFTDRTFTAIADESTMDTSMPDIYLSTTEGIKYQGMTALSMASIDISAVWSKPSIEGVRLHISNSGGDKRQTFEFMKNS